MIDDLVNCDVAKEVITVLSYCDDSFVDKIPDYILKKLNDLAADSLKEVYIDKGKSLMEQNISNECKDLLGMLFFEYMLNSNSKRELLNTLINNN